MSLFVSSLNSGSNGNCYYVGNSVDAVLVDAGLSCKETEKRMFHSGLDMKKVRAIFISHEHTDHIKGVETLSKKYDLPVYITPLTCTQGRLNIPTSRVINFNTTASVDIGDLKISAFPKKHDACDPHSFLIEGNNVTVGVFTDIGSCCSHVKKNFSVCNAVFLESNYDESMLDSGPYPYHLKNRIRGGKGHLSNRQALDLFLNYKPRFLSHIFLSHLSKDNNCPDLARNLFQNQAGKVHISVASRYCASEVFTITAAPEKKLISLKNPDYIQSRLFA